MIAETRDYVALSERYLTDADNQKTFAVGQSQYFRLRYCGECRPDQCGTYCAIRYYRYTPKDIF